MADAGADRRGGDLTPLKNLYTTFQTKNGEVVDLIALLDKMTEESRSYWFGPGPERFREDWRTFKPHLQKLADALHDAHLSAKSSHDRIKEVTEV